MVPNQSPTNPLEEVSDLLDRLPLQACVEVTRRLLTSFYSLPSGAARPRAVLKTVILFVANMAARPRRTVRGKALRLACWNADGVRGRKLELEHFLSHHFVDICLLSVTFLNSGQALLDTIGKLFEKILLTRILHEVGERGLLRYESDPAFALQLG